MATQIVADSDLLDTLGHFRAASCALAHKLGVLRDNYARTDRRLALHLEELRHTYSALALAADRRCVTEQEVLEKLGSLYQSAAIALVELDASGPEKTRAHVGEITALAYLSAGLVSSGTRSIFRD